MKMKRLKNYFEFVRFSLSFSRKIGYEIPTKYFQNCGETWALLDNDGKIYGGFALIYKNHRVIEELPFSISGWMHSNEYAELTGYFLNTKKGSFKLTLKLLVEVLKCKRNQFIYAYPSNQTKLEKYYSYGKPKRIYAGIPKKLEGHPIDKELESQNVEILTKYGILRIFVMRSFKHFLKKGLS